ncbi:MAG: TrmJ/YjtD family RNA methyltransferase [Euryarchaeota archaeon]|jgi:TrmH family RNA methyltransferase|uniref:RNA methyltransferase n=1 Tax=Methanobacterium sp. MZD130B TaxID=3394378 RepID=UPI00176D7846|nr:TrmJ/YjtD family RNA methyltransferase [Euryarchaeota archaeon]HHT18978.1 TrmJ/YjtD family RNA methyltransferase [Methanobacterium sp.]
MIYVVFVEPKTPGNIGFLARTMKNFGLSNLVLINPCQLEHEAYYQSMHAREIIYNRQEHDSLKVFLKKASIDFVVGTTGTAGGSYNLPRISITPENLAQSLNIQGDIALIFGREGDGLTNQELELCDLVVSIPTHESYPILNITHAAAIIFYELFKTQKKYPVENLDEASLEEKKGLIDYADEVLDKLDYPPHKKKNASIVFKRILGRAFISGREAHTLKGMFRRIRDRIN